MSPHPTIAQELVNARSERLRQEAATDRLIRELHHDQPAVADRLLARLGDALVATGTHLRERGAAGHTVTGAPLLPQAFALAHSDAALAGESSATFTFCLIRYSAPAENAPLAGLSWMVMGGYVGGDR
jgi:hypothetical protein